MHRLTTNGHARTLLLIVSLAFNFGVCVAVAVQRAGEPTAKPRGGEDRTHHGHWSGKLGLSGEQSAAVAASRERLSEELRELRSAMYAESETLADLLITPDPNMETISEQVEQVAAIRDQIQWRIVGHYLTIRTVLEPEQLEAFKDFVRRGLSKYGHGGSFGGKAREDRDKRPRHPYRGQGDVDATVEKRSDD